MRAIYNRICRVILVFTIYVYAKQGVTRSKWQNSMVLMDFAITTTGFPANEYLNLPLDDMLADPQSDMPFCLCWANENWTRRWDAADHQVLIAQEYQPDDDLNFIKSLVPFFQDKRYIRLEGRPFLIVYFPQHIPDAQKMIDVWRHYCQIDCIGEIHICAALTHGNEEYAKFGFDSGVEFPPHNLKLDNINHQLSFYNPFRGNVMEYEATARSYLQRGYGNARVFKTVFPSWDNTARTKDRAVIMLNGVPNNYEYWLGSTIDLVKKSGRSDELVFINAWNEWAEGCHLEPDRWFGHAFLEATLNAKSGLRRFTSFPVVGLPHADEIAHRTFWKDIMGVVQYHIWLKMGNLQISYKQATMVAPVVAADY